jgi:hypothetical protein
VTGRVLSERALNRALLARQLLLDRASMSIPAALERVGGLQTQYAPSGYVGLWTRLRDFRRADLTHALEDRSVIQATLMRVTIHTVARADFWHFALGVRQARRELAGRSPAVPAEAELRHGAARLRAALADGPRYVKELDGLAAGFVGTLSLWQDLVRVPPSGTWERRRADRLALAEDWVGPPDATEAEGLVHLVRSYLRAFGPASWRDIASWAGIPVSAAEEAGGNLDVVRYRDAAGRELVDLPDQPLPDPDTPAPVRFLPQFDANLLVHTRRTGLVPEAHRKRLMNIKNPFPPGAVLVDGRVAGGWSARTGEVVVELYEDLDPAAHDAIEAERLALTAFHA